MGKLSENKEKLAHHLAQFQQGGVLNRIGGKDEKGSGGTFQSISPVDKSVICDVARGAADDIDSAATACCCCFCRLEGYAGNTAPKNSNQYRRGDRSKSRGNCPMRMLGYRSGASVYGKGSDKRG